MPKTNPESRAPQAEGRGPSTSTSTRPKTSPSPDGRQPSWQRGRFCHERLDAFDVALEALARGDAIGRQLPRGYGPLADQLCRALVHAYSAVAEAAARSGQDRRARFRTARGEAGEAAAALQALARLGLGEPAEVEAVIELLGRLCAMLTRLCR